NSPVTSINARNRGTTKFLIGSTPNTCNASSSSRIFRAPRSAVIAVPATPANTTAVTNGANSRIDANTKNPPKRSKAPNNTKKSAACNPGASYPNATVEINNGNQHNFNANMNWPTNSAPYGYGGRNAATTVLPVKITIFPTSSSRDLVGKKVFSATARTIYRKSSRSAAAPPARLKAIQPIGRLFENTTLNLRVTRGGPTGVCPDCRWYVPAAFSGSI